jgi:hypothetical protein
MSRSSRDMAADHPRGPAVLGNGGQELVRDIGGRGALDRPADCKFVDRDTLVRLTRADFHLESIVPKAFRVREELI